MLVDKVSREINFLYMSENPYFVCIPTFILYFLSIYVLSDKCHLLV